MPVMESVSSFRGFYDVYPSCSQITHKLARLFEKCENVTEATKRHTISFKEATKRLRTAVENSLSDVENFKRKKVVEFKIGKTSVTSQDNQPFDPMAPTTWGEVGRINRKWREHTDDNYDGLLAVGCVTNELIPKVVKETNTAIPMNHQIYALVMAQALVHHYIVHEPDGRLRNTSIDIGEGEIGDEGGIIYIAYKLTDVSLEMSSLAIKEEEPDVTTATIEFLKIKLEEDGLHFRGSIPDDENSFFKACSDQLQRPEISGHTHSELRQMVITYLNLCSENEIKSAKFTSDTWKVYIDNVAKDKGNVEDIVVENMAKLLQKQIIVYSYKNEISRKKFNEEANGEPLLLAKDKLYYQSLERRHNITPSSLQESNTSKIAESPPLLDDNASSSKLQSMPQEDQRFRTSTSSPVQGTSHEKNLEEANVSEVEWEKGPNEEKIRSARKNMTTDERKLILLCYKKLAIANSWDKLAEEVYEKRNQHLSREMVRHYEDLYAKSKLKNRITSFIQRVKGDTVGNETDQEVIALMKDVREMQ